RATEDVGGADVLLGDRDDAARARGPGRRGGAGGGARRVGAAGTARGGRAIRPARGRGVRPTPRGCLPLPGAARGGLGALPLLLGLLLLGLLPALALGGRLTLPLRLALGAHAQLPRGGA